MRLCGIAVITGLCAAANAQLVLLDQSVFTPGNSTFVDFETDGNGTPITLGAGGTQDLPAAEYAALGFTFSVGIWWVNDGSPEFDAAQAVGGTPDIAIKPFQADTTFDILFSVPVKSFGFWIVDNNTLAGGPSFTAFDAGDNEIGAAVFEGGNIEGAIGVADYGFLGLASETMITKVTVNMRAANLDNFYFSPIVVPAPATAMVTCCGLFAMRRRR